MFSWLLTAPRHKIYKLFPYNVRVFPYGRILIFRVAAPNKINKLLHGTNRHRNWNVVWLFYLFPKCSTRNRHHTNIHGVRERIAGILLWQKHRAKSKIGSTFTVSVNCTWTSPRNVLHTLSGLLISPTLLILADGFVCFLRATSDLNTPDRFSSWICKSLQISANCAL